MSLEAVNPDELPTTAELAQQDPIFRNLVVWCRQGKTLEEAVKEVKDVALGQDEAIETAARLIRELRERIVDGKPPTGGVTRAPAFESWYSGAVRNLDRRWDSLCLFLESDGWQSGDDTDPLDSLNRSSDKVLGLMPFPNPEENFDSRGLVIGYVQSGKTQNFTAMMAKAADAGYKLIIVLSGLHNALRAQTQERLDDQLYRPSGPGYLWMSSLTAQGDFGRPFVDPNGILSPNQPQPVYLVVKKNAARLRSLLAWIKDADPEIIGRCPTCVIDDESDQASVNTADEKNAPTAINGLIRDILTELPKSAYVGYTATPFANVLIDPGVQDEALDLDLYPRDFIVSLPKPSGYVGTEEIFGREPLEFDSEDLSSLGHDLIRIIPDGEIEDLKPSRPSEREEFYPEVTDSLKEAIRYFLLSTAARRSRLGGEKEDATALVHTDQHVIVHQRTAIAIRGFLESLKNSVSSGHAAEIGLLCTTWETECAKVPAGSCGLENVSWEQIFEQLLGVLDDVRVVEDNSRSEDRLAYKKNDPATVIAVGGNTLSRGLTLEGLSVSFFVRSSSAYDTLLQMARWFGYKEPYLDVTRIWLTKELRDWFTHLATVEQEIRYEVERYEAEHVTPLELGVRIRTHPQLAITAAAKMRQAKDADVSYSGRRLQTILFNHKDKAWLDDNTAAASGLISGICGAPPMTGRKNATCFKGVPSEAIIDFLNHYHFQEGSLQLNSELIADYIRQRVVAGELENFTVALMSKADPRNGQTIDLGNGHKLGCIDRSKLSGSGASYADIKALMSATDRAVDILDPSDTALAAMSADTSITRLRNQPPRGHGDDSGLLLLYAISKDSPNETGSTARSPMDAEEHILGVGLVFPESSSQEAHVSYKTADLSHVAGGVDLPDETDAPDESEIEDQNGEQ